MKGIMQEQNVDSNPSRPLIRRKSWKARLGLLGVALVASVALGGVALNYVIPKLPDRAQGVTDRVGWYVQQGQLRADFRTLGAAFEYLIQSDHEIPTAASPTNAVVAEHATPDVPRS